MANRRIDPRRIKTHFSYTVEEAADALGVHKNAVRTWIKGGLAVADNRRPTVMSGAAIRDYLENRVKARKSPLKPGEFYCFSDAEYFNPPANQVRVATARTAEQILHVLATMPAETDIEKRDRAVIAFTLLTGARDGATASFKLKHIDMVAGKVDQDAREVATKRAKTFPTYFFPVGDDIRAIVAEWVDFLRHKKLWGDDDPRFPATEVGIGETGRFGPVGLARRHWSNATAIRKIFKDAFTAAGLPKANPHSFRNTLVQVAYQLQLPPEQFKVWSQNLGHESILTTFSSYGPVTAYRQAEIMRRIATSGAEGAKPEEILSQIVALASRKKG